MVYIFSEKEVISQIRKTRECLEHTVHGVSILEIIESDTACNELSAIKTTRSKHLSIEQLDLFAFISGFKIELSEGLSYFDIIEGGIFNLVVIRKTVDSLIMEIDEQVM